MWYLRQGFQVALVFLATAVSDPALARGIPVWYGYTERLTFVAPLDARVDGVSGEASVCIKTRHYAIDFIPLFATYSYVLAGRSCDGDRYVPLEDEHLAALKGAGALDEAIPDRPAISPATLIEDRLGTLLLALVVMLSLGGALFRSRRRQKRAKILGTSDPEIELFAQVLCVAAKCDGRIEDKEVAVIAEILSQALGRPIAEEEVLSILKVAGSTLSKADYARIGKHFSAGQRAMLQEASLAVMQADGDMSPDETKFAQGLGAIAMVGRSPDGRQKRQAVRNA
jgi:tellurite resistance protein